MLKHLALFLALSLCAFAAPTDEIEALLSYVGSLQGATFIRNSSEHTPPEAVSHMRLKWDRQKEQVATAEDFIHLCGTQSTMSGKPYLIRFADGHKEEAGKVLAKQLKVLRSGTKEASAFPFHRGEPFLDTDGKPINAHGGGILLHEGVYYLYGEIKSGPTTLVSRVGWECYRVEAGGVSCYSSTDLLHWKNLGVALAPNTSDPKHDLHTSKVIERPKVIFNAATKRFVMWMHIDSDDYTAARAGVAVSEHPEGPFHYLGSQRPNGSMARDMTLFKDDDAKGYLVFSSEDNKTLHIVLLTDDYLSPSKTESRALAGLSREAPAIFKHRAIYYLVSSGCTGWAPNPAAYATAPSLLGEWTQHGNPCLGPGADITFNAQSTWVQPLPGKDGEFLFLADLWNKLDLPNSRYLWLPLHVKDGQVEIDGR